MEIESKFNPIKCRNMEAIKNNAGTIIFMASLAVFVAVGIAIMQMLAA